MISTRCDNCEKPITAPDEQAGQKVKCPHCGDVNLLPLVAVGNGPGVAAGGMGGAGRVDRAAAAGYPPADGPEVSVMKLRQSVFRAHPFQFLLGAVVAVAGVTGGSLLGFVTPPAIGLFVLAVVAAGYLAFRKIEKLSASLEITSKRVIERKGLFSRFVSEVRHNDIRNVQVTQSVVDRIFGVGKIGISTAGQEDFEIELRDIAGPEKVRKVIDLYRPL